MTDARTRPADRTVFFVSDGTGITAETFGHSLLSQFEGQRLREIRLPFTDTPDKAQEAVERINQQGKLDGMRPIIFSTLVNEPINAIVRRANAMFLDLIATFVEPLEAEFGVKSTHTMGRFHAVAASEDYKQRIDAIHFSMAHDDGQLHKDLEIADVILVGEMRDAATIRLALTAAETGHLVLSTLHTASAPQAVDRLVDAFPSHEKEAVRGLFAENLIAVLAQTLCPQLGGVGRVAAHEIMVGTPAVKNLIREGKVSQLYSAIQTGQAVGMQTLDQSLLRHFQLGQISADTLRLFSKFHPKSQSDGQSRA
jgi:hypothetical protein